MNKILVIDDDELILKSLAIILKKQGYECRVAKEAQEAIDYARNFEFDIILSDIRMPKINGVDAVKKIQEERISNKKKELPIIFITGYAEDGVIFKAGGLGEIIQKPFDIEHLMATLREYL